MKVYTFELKIFEGSDDFWNAKPSDKEVRAQLAEILAEYGFYVDGDDARDELTLRKYENID